MTAPRRTEALLLVLIASVALLASYLVGTHTTDPVPPAADPGTQGFSAPGTGTVTAVPDQLSFTISITRHSGDSVDAMNQTNAAVRVVRRALTGAAVARKDITTTDVSIYPTYRYSGGSSIPTGFSSSQGLRVLVRDLPSADAILSKAAVSVGNGGRIGGVSMEIGDRTALMQRARAKAMADSRAAAGAYAAATGTTVGEVRYVDETTPTPDYSAGFRGAALDSASLSALAAKSVPIEAGQQDVTVQVKVRWAIG